MMTVVLFISFVLLLTLNVPISFSLLISSLIALAYQGIPLMVIVFKYAAKCIAGDLIKELGCIEKFIIESNIVWDNKWLRSLAFLTLALAGVELNSCCSVHCSVVAS